MPSNEMTNFYLERECGGIPKERPNEKEQY